MPSLLIWSATAFDEPVPTATQDHDRGDADQDAEHRERRAQLVRDDAADRDAQVVAPRSSTLAAARRVGEDQAVAQADRRRCARAGDVLLVRDHDDRAAGAVHLARRSSMTSAEATLSRLPVGSSARISAGFVTSARATAARCCWPPESSFGTCRARSARPTAASAASARARRSRRPDAHVGERQLDVRERRGARDQVEALEDEADLAAAHARERRASSSVAHVDAVEPVPAARRHVEAADDVHQRRLARARRAHDRDEVAALDGQRDAAQRVHLDVADRVRLDDLTQLDDGRGEPRPRAAAARATALTVAGSRAAAAETAAAEAAASAERRRSATRSTTSSRRPRPSARRRRRRPSRRSAISVVDVADEPGA